MPPTVATYYYVDDAGQRHGPVAPEAIRSLVAGGRLSPDAPVWAKGMPQWTPARRVPGLLPTNPPPLPTPLPPPLPPPPPARQRSRQPEPFNFDDEDEPPARPRRSSNRQPPRQDPRQTPRKAAGAPLVLILAGAAICVFVVGAVSIWLIVRNVGDSDGAGGGSYSSTERPANLVGRWSGSLTVDVNTLPAELRQVAVEQGIHNVQFPFEVEGTSDGTFYCWIQGAPLPALNGSRSGSVIDGSSANEGISLTGYAATADSVEFTIREQRRATKPIISNVYYQPGAGPVDTTTLLTLRRSGNDVDCALTFRSLNSSLPTTLKGRLAKR